MATCCGITMTSCELKHWLRARHSNSLGLPPSHAFKLFLRFYVLSEQMFAYVLSYMLDGELMFAVLDVAVVFFPDPHFLPKEHSLEAVFFSPLHSSCPPPPFFYEFWCAYSREYGHLCGACPMAPWKGGNYRLSAKCNLKLILLDYLINNATVQSCQLLVVLKQL